MSSLLDALSDSENTIDLQDENLITPIHEFLEINPEKRLITIPESEQLFGVYGENKVEIKYFKCPRIILNDIDLYECYIFINYISASGKIGYIQADTVVLDETESYIIFTWELTRNVFDENIDTDIYFSISAKQYLEDKEPVFFTRKAKGNLYETVYAEEQITEQYADIILQLLANNETKVDLPVDEEGNLLVPKEGQTLLFREDGTTYYGTISAEDVPPSSGGATTEQITEIINTALAQAKESGEFNGKDGEDGYTPIKGTDYFTDADKQGFVTDVLNALPTWTRGNY